MIDPTHLRRYVIGPLLLIAVAGGAYIAGRRAEAAHWQAVQAEERRRAAAALEAIGAAFERECRQRVRWRT